MRNMTLENMAAACAGELCGSAAAALCEAEDIVIDSRKVCPGAVFVATRGERVDGHSFIPQAFEKGAMAVICEQLPENPSGPCIQVKDSFSALRDLAAFYRRQFEIPVVGITGSVGKTSTKELVASVLAQKYNVLKTDGNFNNQVGLPLTVFRLRPEHEAAVLEMGIDGFGQMEQLSRIATPQICVITNIGGCHLEALGDRDGVLAAKSRICDYMPQGGTLIVNGEDDKLITIKEAGGKTPVRYGYSSACDIWADNIENHGLKGSSAVIHTPAGDIAVRIPLPGVHNVGNAMAAAAAGLELGLSAEQIAAGAAAVQPVKGRSHLIDTGKLLVIDDCYNANPVSVKAGIDLLGFAEGRKVAVLGDMFELGGEEEKLHAEIGSYAAAAGIDLLICIGSLSRLMYEAALAAGANVHYFENNDAFLAQMTDLILEGDSVLVKASHGMNFPQIVEALQNL